MEITLGTALSMTLLRDPYLQDVSVEEELKGFVEGTDIKLQFFNVKSLQELIVFCCFDTFAISTGVKKLKPIPKTV